jgi:ferredoxin
MARRKRKAPFWSRVRIQSSLVATAIMHLNLFGISLKKFCTPGFNCHACAWSSCACPVGIVAYGSAVRTLPVLAISTLVAIGIVFGRLVCAFVCPFGFFQDLMHRIPSPKLRLPRFLNYGRYVALVLLVLVLPYAFGFENSVYASLDTDSGGYEYAELTVSVENPGEESIRGVELDLVHVAFDDETGEERVLEYSRESRSFPDVVVPAGGELELPKFRVRSFRNFDADGNEHEAELLVTPRGSTLDEDSVWFDESYVEMIEVAVTVQNLSTEPVKGVELAVQYVDEEEGYPVWELPGGRSFPDVVVPPGESVALPVFVIEPKRTHEAGEEERPTQLYVSSPLMQIRPEINDFHYFCRLCPTASLTVTVPSLFAETEEPWSYRVGRVGLRLSILAGFLVLMVVFARPFCRIVCPLGAIYSLFNRLSFVTMKIVETCNECGVCSKACPLDLDVAEDLGGADCIQCGDCIGACPHGSISRTIAFPAPRVTPKAELPSG